MEIICATETSSRSFDTQKMADIVTVLIVRVDDLSLAIHMHFPLCETFLMLDVDEL